MTAGREGTLQMTRSASAKAGCIPVTAATQQGCRLGLLRSGRGGERPAEEDQGLLPVL